MKQFIKTIFGANFGARTKQASRPKTNRFRPAVEVLEERALMSAIVWENRASTSPSSNDQFDTVFGTQAPAARLVVDAAINSWQLIDNK